MGEDYAPPTADARALVAELSGLEGVAGRAAHNSLKRPPRV